MYFSGFLILSILIGQLLTIGRKLHFSLWHRLEADTAVEVRYITFTRAFDRDQLIAAKLVTRRPHEWAARQGQTQT